jgi:hypothetical protein
LESPGSTLDFNEQPEVGRHGRGKHRDRDQIEIPDALIPSRANVEISAKRFAEYFSTV